jgi:hypothetical protein
MTKLMTKIHDAETGEVIEREMNATELAIIAKDKINREAIEAATATAIAAKEAAQAKLAALGLTISDLEALGL